MNVIWILARREFADSLRNRWLIASILLLSGLVLLLSLLGSAPVGQVDASALEIAVASLTSLGVYLIPLITLMISFDSLVGEMERGTLPLLLTYPVQRWQVLLGKYLGLLAVSTLAIVIGYGVGAVYLASSQDNAFAGWQSYALLIASSVLLGAVFLALGLLSSCLAKSRSSALTLALGLWFALVIFYDLALLGLLLSSEQALLDEQQFSWLLLLNPADAYRLFNLSSPAVGKLVGIWGNNNIGLGQAFTVMFVWVAVCLGFANQQLKRKEL